MSESIEEIRWRTFASGNPSDDTCALLAEVDRLTAELATERAAHELEKRAHERTWKHKAKMIDERDAAIRERDALKTKIDAIRELMPDVVYDDDPLTPVAAVLDCPHSASEHHWKDGCPSCYADELRAHAAGVDAPRVDAGCEDSDRIYPCVKCGKLRTRSEGGTVFTVCDSCWDSKHGTGRTEAAKGE